MENSIIPDALRKWSDQQTLIFQEFKTGKGNLVIRARAGTGKTTTIIEGITFAPEKKILLAAFNKKIAEELKSRLKNPCAEAKTLHSIGFGFVMRNWQGITLDEKRGERLARRACGDKAPDVVVNLVRKLSALGKNMCIEPTVQQLMDIADDYDLTLDEEWEEEGWTSNQIAAFAHKALAAACQKDGFIDFDDMVYVPVRNKWVRPKYDLVVIDEAQDMNAVQIELARKVCKGRVIVVGDDRQAIYGFRGADSGSIDRLKRELNAKELGLNTTYRCPKSVVEIAAKIVPDFKATPSAPDGIVEDIAFEKLHEMANAGDFVLSRKNAPLAKVCLRILKHGKRALIEGKDVGAGLVALVNKIKGVSIIDFLKRLEKWQTKQCDRARAQEKKGEDWINRKVESINDQAECLSVLAEGMAGLKELRARIEMLFAETRGGKNDYVICSSVHRSKGLERDTVFVLSETMIKPGIEGHIEEQNITYVAITRSKRRLVFVKGIA